MLQILIILLTSLITANIVGWIIVAVTYVYCRANGYRFIHVTNYWFRWYRDFYDQEKPGRLKFSVGKMNDVIPRLYVAKKPMPTHAEIRKMAKRDFVVFLIVSIPVMVLLFYCRRLVPEKTYPQAFFGGVTVGTSCTLLAYLFLSFSIMRKPKGLRLQTELIIDALRTQETMKATVLPAFDRKAFYDSVSISDRINYVNFYYRFAEVKNNLPGMMTAAHEYEKVSGTSIFTDTGHFMLDSTLFDYYSFREFNPELAKKYYLHSQKRIDADTDANGRRRLAYYSFYVLNDYAAARKYAEEGLASLSLSSPESSEVLLDFEVQMLKYLLSRIDEQEHPSTIQNQVITEQGMSDLTQT